MDHKEQLEVVFDVLDGLDLRNLLHFDNLLPLLVIDQNVDIPSEVFGVLSWFTESFSLHEGRRSVCLLFLRETRPEAFTDQLQAHCFQIW